jgi:integrase
MSAVTGHVLLVKRKRGDQWYLHYRLPGGRQVKKRLGPAYTGKGRPPSGHFTRKTAQVALDALLTDLRRGTVRPAPHTGVTFAEAAAEWLRWIERDRKRRPSTVSDYRSVVDARLAPEFGAEPVEAITTERIDRWRAGLVAEGKLSARTINKYLALLHSIFKRAVRFYELSSNPAAGVDRQPQRRSGDINVLTPDEVRLLALHAETQQDAALYTVAAFAGLRLGELRALRWADVDFAKQLIHVRRNYTGHALGVPKSGKVRSVPLIDPAARAIDGLSRRERFTEPDDLVFIGMAGDHFDDSALRRRFVKALDRARLKRLRFHDLRHTFGTIAVQAFPLTDVKAYMGHADIATTLVYVHFVPQADAAAKLAGVVEGDDLQSGYRAGYPNARISGDLSHTESPE